jgi:4'-phosphopantetheinyl transferase
VESCPERVEIWRIGLRPPGRDARAFAGLLDGREQARSARIEDPADRARYVVAHAAVRLILSRRLGLAPRSLTWTLGPHGKPRLAGPRGTPHTSLSHSADVALLALARREVGVDIERIAGRWRTRPPAGFFPPAEAAAVAAAPPDRRAELFVRLLTRKEACVKAEGITMLPHGIRLGTTGSAPLTVAGPEGEWRVRDVRVDDGYGAAVALRGTGDFSVLLRAWSPGEAAEPGQPAAAAARLRMYRSA